MSKREHIEEWGMFTEEGNRFVQQTILPHMLDYARSGLFVDWHLPIYRHVVQYDNIDWYVDGYVRGLTSASKRQQHSELGDTVVRRCIKTALAVASERYAKKENEEVLDG
jgi:hypothetical protein